MGIKYPGDLGNFSFTPAVLILMFICFLISKFYWKADTSQSIVYALAFPLTTLIITISIIRSIYNLFQKQK